MHIVYGTHCVMYSSLARSKAQQPMCVCTHLDEVWVCVVVGDKREEGILTGCIACGQVVLALEWFTTLQCAIKLGGASFSWHVLRVPSGFMLTSFVCGF